MVQKTLRLVHDGNDWKCFQSYTAGNATWLKENSQYTTKDWCSSANAVQARMMQWFKIFRCKSEKCRGMISQRGRLKKWGMGRRRGRLKKGQNWFLGLRRLRPAAKNSKNWPTYINHGQHLMQKKNSLGYHRLIFRSCRKQPMKRLND